MKTRGMGRSIMAGAIVCFIIYTLLTLSSPVPLNVGLGGILFYIGIVALPLGVVLFLFGDMKR
jgi:xanthosine utilization system XapX-like protein